MILGADALGAVFYAKALLRAHTPGFCVGIFYRTFVNKSVPPKKLVRLLVESKKVSELVIHLAPFDRSHTYPIDRLQKQILTDAKELEAFANNGTKILLSPFCEHNHSAKNISPFLDQLRAVAPSCEVVNSIWKGEEVPNTITEIHLERGTKPRPKNKQYIVSFDGFGGDGRGDFTDCDIDHFLNYYKDARQIRFWNFRCNGKFGHKDTAPVDSRKHWPSVEWLRGHYEIVKGREGAASWPYNALLKPFGDDHGEGGKDNKLLFILPEEASSIEVLNSLGTVIDRPMRFYPNHSGTPKGARYYSNFYACQVGDKAEQSTKSRLVSVRVRLGRKNGKPFYKHYPLTDVDLRSGLYR